MTRLDFPVPDSAIKKKIIKWTEDEKKLMVCNFFLQIPIIKTHWESGTSSEMVLFIFF